MPRRLPQRCLPDSIQEFRAAAQHRFEEGLDLEAAGRRTAAIYLWGYAAEMTLKAAYFAVVGFSETRIITMADLRGAASTAPNLGVIWPGLPHRANLHDLKAWADLLVAYRSMRPGLAYPVANFGDRLKARGRLLQLLWNETLRYHKNVAYSFEVNQARDATEWLMNHSDNL